MSADQPPALWWSPTEGLVTPCTTPPGFMPEDGGPQLWAELPADAVQLVSATGRPSPAQWAAWFRSCADMADSGELSDDHRKVFRLVAEHFESAHVVRMAGEITGVDQ